MVKVDPARPWDEGLLKLVLSSGTDAIVVGGTQDITMEGLKDLLWGFRDLDPSQPLFVEVSSPACLVPGADGYLVPVVLNSIHTRYLIGEHVEVLLKLGSLAEMVRPVPEFYLVLNPGSAVGLKTGSQHSLDEARIKAYFRAARLLLGARLLYLEGSGRYYGPAPLKAAREVKGEARLFYGGGISSAHQAREAGSLADTIVVGNLIYHNPKALEETVKAVKQ